VPCNSIPNDHTMTMAAENQSYQSGDGVPLLRVETTEWRRALPLATLLAAEVSLDGTRLVLEFAVARVEAEGVRLDEIFAMLSAGTCAALYARGKLAVPAGAGKAPVITRIRFISISEDKNQN
jgi:hypothetical protein